MSKDKADPPPKKSKKKLLLILVAVLAVAGGGGYFMLGSGPKAPEPGTVLALDAITVNLTDGHFLKLGIALQATKGAGENLDGSKALDLAIEQFSNLSVAELSNEGRAREKAALKKKVVKAYEGEVMDIYLTDFVMQ